jgi:uncharacterized protein with PIN domain/sulfur carrier protein ThiS
MAKADFYFAGELNFFLPLQRKNKRFSHYFEERAAIKDTIEALGIPHPEVDLILVNSEPVDFSYIVTDGDEVEVYPVSAAIQAQPSNKELGDRFILDVHLGKLANALRMLGFDTLYRNDYDDEELAKISAAQNRILLTRDKGLLMRSIVTRGYYVRETHPEGQVKEVLQRFNLFDQVSPFHRCIRCNGLLEPVSKEAIADQLLPKTRQAINEFHRCCECRQIYWKGSHYAGMQHFVQEVLNSRGERAQS